MKRRKRTLNISSSLSRMLTRATVLNTAHSPAREESRAQLEFSELHPMRYEPLSTQQFPMLFLWKAPRGGGEWMGNGPIHTHRGCYRHCSSTATPQWEIIHKEKVAESWTGSNGRHAGLGNGDGQNQFTGTLFALLGKLCEIYNKFMTPNTCHSSTLYT